jgi:hypothetical protein
MKKKNLIIAIASIVAVCLVVVICCVCLGKSNPDTNTEQTTTNTETNPGNENSDHNDNDDIINDSDVDDDESNNTDNNGSENVEDNASNDNNTDSENVEDNTSNDNNTDSENDSSTSEPSDNENNNNENDNADDNTDTPQDAEPTVIGFALYVCEANSSLPYSNGQRVNGVLQTIEDGRTIYTFGDYEAVYIADIVQNKVWSMKCEYSDNLVYCSGFLNKRNDGTYYAAMAPYYVNTTGNALVYYTASIYRHNNDYYLIADTTRYDFVKNKKVYPDNDIVVNLNGMEVDVYTYITLDTEMYNGLYDGFTITFYDEANNVVGSETYTNNNLPDEIVWKSEAYTASITHYYNGNEDITIYKNRRDIAKSNRGYDWNTVIDGVSYHHHISWILEN